MQPLLTRITAVQWLILLAILPFILFPTPSRSLILLLLPLLWSVRKLSNRRFLPSTPLDTSLLLFSLAILISLSASYDLSLSLPKAISLVYSIALYYAIADTNGRFQPQLQTALAIFLLAGLAILLVSLIGTNWQAKLPGFAPIISHIPTRLLNIPSATDGFSPNEVAGTLLWFLPLSLSLALAPRALARHLTPYKLLNLLIIPFLWVLALLALATLILTQSRSGYLALLATIPFILAALLHQHKRLVFGLFIFVIGLSLGLLILIGGQQAGQLLATFSKDVITSEGLTLTGRTEIWARAIYGIQDFPLTGMGLNLFRHIVPVLYPFFTLSNETDIAHAHNQFLQTGVELGLLGLIAYLAIWLGAIALLWQSWRLAEDSWAKALVIGFAASLIAAFVFGLTDAVSLGAKPGFMFWLLLGLISAHNSLLRATLSKGSPYQAAHVPAAQTPITSAEHGDSDF